MAENCSNGVDDNNDGMVDCADPTCTHQAPCNRQPQNLPTAEVCNDGVDNDEEGEGIWVVRGPRQPWARLWPRMKHYE